MAMPMAMTLYTAKPFFLVHNSNNPALFSLPKTVPTYSFHCHAISNTLTAFSTSNHLFRSPVISISKRTSLPLTKPFALTDGDESIPPINQTGDITPPTLSEDEWGNELETNTTTPQNGSVEQKDTASGALYVDEWGDKADPDELAAQTKLPDADPSTMSDDDEWGGSGTDQIPGTVPSISTDTKLTELKQCLVDSFYGTEYGLTVSSQTRAEIGELISELEALNPTPAPTEAPSLLQGNWVLVYTSFSELLPLIAAGRLPFVKIGKICQSINTDKFTIENSVSYIGPFATSSVRALASFEVRSSKRIQVKFEEGIIPPPKITSKLDIPENIEFFGQKINLSSLQGSLYPFQEAVTRISQVISGQSPLKIPIRRDGAQSWLLTTYLDEDLRISRGDGAASFRGL
ncbi:hypothetical protein SUGI_0784320 [Cryptomeria japonica]|nr:hypothetical protein SUGI_0784320 [Cryptomeria japonica]